MDEYATSRFPNVFVQGLNLAKNRPTSLIWTEYTTDLVSCCRLIINFVSEYFKPYIFIATK